MIVLWCDEFRFNAPLAKLAKSPAHEEKRVIYSIPSWLTFSFCDLHGPFSSLQVLSDTFPGLHPLYDGCAENRINWQNYNSSDADGQQVFGLYQCPPVSRSFMSCMLRVLSMVCIQYTLYMTRDNASSQSTVSILFHDHCVYMNHVWSRNVEMHHVKFIGRSCTCSENGMVLMETKLWNMTQHCTTSVPHTECPDDRVEGRAVIIVLSYTVPCKQLQI